MIFERAQTVFGKMLHVVYPPRCVGCGVLVDGDFGLCASCWRETKFIGGLICDTCGVPLPGDVTDEAATCDDCLSNSRPWERGRSALLYQGLARQHVLRLKHGDRSDIVRPAAEWMAGCARDLLSEDTVFVPIPLHWRRLLNRKYNQSGLLAQALARKYDRTFCPDALIRHQATRPQSGPREARISAVSTVFRVNPRRLELLRGRPIILIDDVMTSGATLNAAAEVLTECGPSKIDVLVLARAAAEP